MRVFVGEIKGEEVVAGTDIGMAVSQGIFPGRHMNRLGTTVFDADVPPGLGSTSKVESTGA